MVQSLESLQRRLYRLITTNSTVDRTAAATDSPRNSMYGGLETIVRSDERLPAAVRVGIYAEAYFYRLLEVMKEDYPAILSALGDRDFQSLISDYLAAYPPHRPSVFYAGEFLADFIRGHQIGDGFPFAADLARLERTLIEVFHGPDAPALTEDRLREIAPSRWPAINMRVHPTVRLVDSQWKVADTKREVDRGAMPSAPACEPCRILCWRQNDLSYYRELERPEYGAFELMLEGSSFATVCDAIVVDKAHDNDRALAIDRLLRRWLADGVLLSLEA
jgi:hypothetical protein